MDGYAGGLNDINRFFDFDTASSSNAMATDAMQSTHETADSTQTAIQDPLKGIINSSDNLALNWGHANHEFSTAAQTLLPDFTVAPYEMETPNTYTHSHTREPVDSLSYNSDFDSAGDGPSSCHYTSGRHAYDQAPAPGQLYDSNAQIALSEQLKDYDGFK